MIKLSIIIPFKNSEKFHKEENKRKKYKKIIITVFKIFYVLPKKVVRLLTFK